MPSFEPPRDRPAQDPDCAGFRPHPAWGGHAERERMPGDGWTGPEEPRAGDGGYDPDLACRPARGAPAPAPGQAPPRTRRRPDAELREAVREALLRDPWVDARTVTVDASDGVVTLSGELPGYAEVRYATDDAWDVDGVRGVRPRLHVRGEPPAPDRAPENPAG